MFDLIESPDPATRRELIALSVRYGRCWPIAEALAEMVAVAQHRPKTPLAGLPPAVRLLYLELGRQALDEALRAPTPTVTP